MRSESTGVRREPPWLALYCSGIVVLAALFAATGIPRWVPGSILLRWGIPAPTTGLTRSFVALARGDAAGSFAWNPLGPVLAALVAAGAVAGWVTWARGVRIPARWLGSRPAVVAMSATVVAVWVRQIVALDV